MAQTNSLSCSSRRFDLMSLTDPILELLAYEVAFIFAVIAGLLIVKNLKRHRRVNSQTGKTVKQIKKNQEQRALHIKSLLSEQYGLEGEALDNRATEFLDREKLIYKNLLKSFVEQDGKAFSNLPEQVEQAIDSALNIVPKNIEQPEEAETEADFEAVIEPEPDKTEETEDTDETQPAEPEQVATSSEAEPSTEDEEKLFSDSSFMDTQLETNEDESNEEIDSNEEAEEQSSKQVNDEEPASEQITDERAEDQNQADEESLRADEIEALLEGESFDLEGDITAETEEDTENEGADTKSRSN
ncbi:MAG: hypothetical protein VYB22_08975, partial [Pseudomonadota bacterium]|nr:hypothetical protein [Pseudomonadota bacterium]